MLNEEVTKSLIFLKQITNNVIINNSTLNSIILHFLLDKCEFSLSCQFENVFKGQ